MPRRKRTFINRARAKTFQLVNAPTETNPSHHVFMPISADDKELPKILDGQTEIDADVLVGIPQEEEYDRKEYELGEFGFPEDGYNYAQHFRRIGGGGGVFMDAITGLPNPDAVSSSRRRRISSKPEASDELCLRSTSDVKNETLQPPDNEVVGEKTWLSPEDEQIRVQAIEEIKRGRRHNPDLDEVFAYLDSDGELESTVSDPVDQGIDEIDQQTFDDLNSDSNSGLLEDDFIALANAPGHDGSDLEENGDDLWKNIREPYRNPRALDEQFEKFMNGFQLDSTDEEYEEIKQQLMDQAEKQRNNGDLVAHEQSEEFWEDSELLEGISALKCDDEICEGEPYECEGQNVSSEAGIEQSREREKDFEQYAVAEFESGMKSLLDSYVRATPKEAFEAFDGLDKAREALRKAELEDEEYVEKLDDLDIEDNYNDPELDSHFEEMYKQEEKWDCETILSTYSNLENHPSVIDAPTRHQRPSVQRAPIIRLDERAHAPLEFSNDERPATSAADVDYGTRRSAAGVPSRSRNETKEEKRTRKAAAKQLSRERRALKSEMKKAFGAEQTKQGRHETAIGKAKVAVKF